MTRLALLSLLAALLASCRPAAWRAKRRRLQRLLAEPPRRHATHADALAATLT